MEPPLFVAVTVYVVAVCSVVGMPDISPVVVFKVKPAGKEGHEYVIPEPFAVGVLVIRAPMVYTTGVAYVKSDGAARFTVIVIVAFVEPPELVAAMV